MSTNVVDETPVDDWMIFIDLDAYLQSSDKAALWKVLWKQHHLYNRQHASSGGQNAHQCEVIAATPTRSINMDVLVINATEHTRQLVKSWYQLQLYHGFCLGASGPVEDYALEERLKYEEATYFNTRRACAMSRLNTHKKKSLGELQLRTTTPKNEHNNVPLGIDAFYF
jgi:hypothetical protein